MPKYNNPRKKNRKPLTQKKFIKWVKFTLHRLFIDPCYGCVRQGKCELFDRKGFCGDWGICWYEKGGE